MSDPSISPVTNGVHGAPSNRPRGHRRNHGLSLNGGSLSHAGLPGYYLAPPTPRHVRSPSSPLAQSFTLSESAAKPSPPRSHSRQNSEALFPASPRDAVFSPVSVVGINLPQTPRSPPAKARSQVVYNHKEDEVSSRDGLDFAGRWSATCRTGVLITLPYLILSICRQFVGLSPSTGTESASRHTFRRSAIVDASSAAAVTLLLLGTYKFWTRGNEAIPEKERSAVRVLPRMVAESSLSMFLPFYAACILGGHRVALLLLIALFTKFPASVQRESAKTGRPLLVSMVSKYKYTAFLLLVLAFADLSGISSGVGVRDAVRGYLALTLAIVFCRAPSSSSSLFSPAQADGPGPTLEKGAPSRSSDHGAAELLAGGFLAVGALLAASITGEQGSSLATVPIAAMTGCVSAFAFAFCPPSSAVRSEDTLGLLAGLLCVLIGTLVTSGRPHSSQFISQLFFSCSFFVAVALDLGTGLSPFRQRHSHGQHHRQVQQHKPPSRISLWLLNSSEGWPLIHSILKERDSRRIFYFMSLNFAFMMVQMVYGVLTGSLGLISDSIHMLFDCAALVVGLAAAVMSKWPPSPRFPYGYGKVDTLAGFANGVFLMIISVEIVYEAVERLYSGSEVQRLGELFVVSTLGLLVNMVGIFAFDHAHHGHSHGGHDHSHDHGNENMHGIFLHILADALGSVAVVGSTILVHFFGWPGFDPLASCVIAVLIFFSAIPLVASTSKTLLLSLPADVEYTIRDTLGGLNTVRGVVGYAVPRFWLDDSKHASQHEHSHDHHHHHSHDHAHDKHHHVCHDHSSHQHSHSHPHDHAKGHSQRILGVIHIICSRNASLGDAQRRTLEYFSQRNMDVLVQVEREGETECWCGGGNKHA